MNPREGLSRAACGRLGILGESMHVTSQCFLFRLSFQPIRLSQTVSEKYILHYDIQPVLVTTTPEQFANQPGIITNPHPFVLFTTAAATTYFL